MLTVINCTMLINCAHSLLSVFCVHVFTLIFKGLAIWPIVSCLVPDIIVMKRGANLTSYSRIKKTFLTNQGQGHMDGV